MRWPFFARRRPDASAQQLCFMPTPQGLVWLRSRPSPGGPEVVRHGLLQRPDTLGEADWSEALAEIGRPATPAMAVLPLADYQLLQIEAPPVPPEELRAAARWRIRELVDGHVDDITLDVLHVGPPPGPGSSPQPLFVVAAPNPRVAACGELARRAGWALSVVDVSDLAQRNLHTAASATLDLSDRATACLVRHADQCLLTLCVGEELYDTRRLAWDERLPAQAAAAQGARDTGLDDAGAPRLLIELQRSFDVWERSWPDLPMSLLWLDLQDDTPTLAPWLQDQLGMRCLPLSVPEAPPEWADLSAVTRRQLLPLLGLLRRQPFVQP
ncbi:hypothetical protein [Ideonella livida]|uniref:Agglutinin biogenesis protein MshI n=1 Tax=Ideonella livida TaxID=2707176 RepID=A0A7C9PEW2_9BURK|nr:hypothetical protein [Ideonella livida]NDY89871.1 hypothetical protein [Ideonella livida]